HDKRISIHCKPHGIETTCDEIVLTGEKQLPRGCIRSRCIRIEQPSRLRSVELTHVDAPSTEAACRVVKKVLLIGKELREAVTRLGRHVQARYGRLFPTGGAYTEQRTGPGWSKDNRTVAIPCSTTTNWRGSQYLDRAAIDVDSFEIAICEET